MALLDLDKFLDAVENLARRHGEVFQCMIEFLRHLLSNSIG